MHQTSTYIKTKDDGGHCPMKMTFMRAIIPLAFRYRNKAEDDKTAPESSETPPIW